MLVDALAQLGITADLTREPGGTPGAEAIRGLLLDPPGEGGGAQAEALLFAAARADHVARRIRPAIDRGDWVISDRFVDSSRAYQGGAGQLGDKAVVALHAIGSGGLRPDLTLLLEADEEQVAARLAERDGDNSDAIGGRNSAYHRAVAAAFRRYAEEDTDGFAIIDASGTPEDVHRQIMSAIAHILDG